MVIPPCTAAEECSGPLKALSQITVVPKHASKLQGSSHAAAQMQTSRKGSRSASMPARAAVAICDNNSNTPTPNTGFTSEPPPSRPWNNASRRTERGSLSRVNGCRVQAQATQGLCSMLKCNLAAAAAIRLEPQMYPTHSTRLLSSTTVRCICCICRAQQSSAVYRMQQG